MTSRPLRYAVGFALFSLALLSLLAASASQVQGASSSSGNSVRDTSPLTPVPTCDVPSWQVIPSQNPSSYTNYLQGVSAISENDAWAVGYYNTSSGSPAYSLVERWNGSQWTSMTMPHVGSSSNRLAAVEAIAPDDVWAVGHYRYVTQPDPYDQTLILHWNGSQWEVIPSPNVGTWNNFLYSISAVSPTDIWAVGSYKSSVSAPEHTLTMHWDGSQWSIIQSPNLGSSYNILRGVTAIASNDVWAVGYWDAGANPDQTLILHWNGSQWETVPSANAPTGFSLLYSVDAASANDVWAVGYNSNPPGGQVRTLVQRWNGSSWSLVDSPNPGSTYNSLNGVAVVSSTDVWAVGNSNSGSGSQTLTLHWDGQSWTHVPSPNATGGNWLNAVDAVSSRHVWAVGYSGPAGAYRTLTLLYTGNDPCGTPGPSSTASIVATATATACPPGSPGSWLVRASQPSALYGSTAASDGTVVYVAGGSADGTTPSNIVRRYNPANDSWVTLAQMPSNSAKANAVYAPNVDKLFVFGGDSLIGGSIYNITRIYNPGTNTWTLGTPMPGGRWGMAAGYHNGKIYLAGGFDGATYTNSTATWEYDPITNSWNTSRMNMPVGLNSPGSAIINGHLYVAGGLDDGYNVRNTLYDYDIAANTWTTRASLPTALFAPGSGALGSKLWVFGGRTTYAGAGAKSISRSGAAQVQSPSALNSTYIYDPVSNTWAAGPNLNVARSHIAGGVVGNTVVAAGGADSTSNVIYDTTETNTAPGVCVTATVTSTSVAATSTMAPSTSTATGTPVEPELAILQYVIDNNPTLNCQGPSGSPGHRRITNCMGGAGHSGDGAVDNYGSPSAAQAQWQSLRQAAQGYPIFGDTTFGNGYPGYYAGNNNYPYAHYEVNFWGSVWVMGATSTDDTHFRFAPHLANAIFNAARTLGYLPPNPPVETVTPTASSVATAIQTTAPTQGPTNTATSTMMATSTIAATSMATTISTFTATTTATPVVTATSTTTTTATAIVCAITFTDVLPGHTFYDAIRCLACRGVVSGYADGTFKPDNLVTRGQLAKIVSNAANFTEPPGTQIFQDVAPDHTFYEWINRLTNRGYMSGYTCGNSGEPCINNRPYFRPFSNATRAQTSKIVANAARYNEPVAGQTFEDVPPTHPFYEWIQRLASRAVMGGYTCGSPGEPCVNNRPYFRPYNDVTRGQSAKIVAGAFACSTP